jgi:predicted amidophosphoribosyltransferase
MKNKPEPCPQCGEKFSDVFEAVDHLLEEDEEFDPALILPNGYRLMIGSLLKCMYKHAHEPEQIEKITQDTFMTLYMAETQPNVIVDVIEDMIVGTTMAGIDDEIKQLLENGE